MSWKQTKIERRKGRLDASTAPHSASNHHVPPRILPTAVRGKQKKSFIFISTIIYSHSVMENTEIQMGKVVHLKFTSS
jgi:hypothetical protein